MADLQDVINSRRTIYRFSDKLVKEKDLEAAFHAANSAPCHKLTFPWKFYVLGMETREKLLERVGFLAREKADKKGESDKILAEKKAISKIRDVPVIIAVTSKLTAGDIFREQEDYAATVCSLHNLVLSLWDLGIGSQWSTGSITRDDSTYAHLQIDSQKEKIIGFLKIGYPEKIPQNKPDNPNQFRYYLP